jgi:hypothetical protein
MLNPSCCSVLTFVSFLVNLSFNLLLDLIIVLPRLWIFRSVPEGTCFTFSVLLIFVSVVHLDVVMWSDCPGQLVVTDTKELKKFIFWFWFHILKPVWDTVNKREIKKRGNSLEPHENFSTVDQFLSLSKLTFSVYVVFCRYYKTSFRTVWGNLMTDLMEQSSSC